MPLPFTTQLEEAKDVAARIVPPRAVLAGPGEGVPGRSCSCVRGGQLRSAVGASAKASHGMHLDSKEDGIDELVTTFGLALGKGDLPPAAALLQQAARMRTFVCEAWFDQFLVFAVEDDARPLDFVADFVDGYAHFGVLAHPFDLLP